MLPSGEECFHHYQYSSQSVYRGKKNTVTIYQSWLAEAASPIPQEEVHNVERGEIFKVNGQVEGSKPPGVARQGGTQIDPLSIYL